jgi:hypothetical protein
VRCGAEGVVGFWRFSGDGLFWWFDFGGSICGSGRCIGKLGVNMGVVI